MLRGAVTDRENRMCWQHRFRSISKQADPSEQPRNPQLCPGLLFQDFIQLGTTANLQNSIYLLKFFPISSVSGTPHVDCKCKCLPSWEGNAEV